MADSGRQLPKQLPIITVRFTALVAGEQTDPFRPAAASGGDELSVRLALLYPTFTPNHNRRRLPSGSGWLSGPPALPGMFSEETLESRTLGESITGGVKEAGNGCRIAVRRRKGSAFGLAPRAPLPRRAGMRRAGGVFPKNREDETPTRGTSHGRTSQC